jgi:hypothetical protein
MVFCPGKQGACRLPATLLLCLALMTGCGPATGDATGTVSAASAKASAKTPAIATEASALPDAGVLPSASPEAGVSAAAQTTAQTAAQAEADGEAPASDTPPSREALSIFPGVLRAMSLPREEVLATLGEGFETYDNVSRAFSVYTWAESNLMLEYDSLSGRLRTIRVGERSIFLDGADYQEADLNGDGIKEGICSFEDIRDSASLAGAGVDPTNRREGHVAILDEQTGKSISECYTRPFGGFSNLSFLTAYGTDKECLVIIDTQSYWECDVLSFAGGQLVSMLPADALQLTEQAKVTRFPDKPDRVQLDVESVGLSFDCLMPERLQEALADGQEFSHRFLVNRKPVITDDGLSLQLRNSLQVMLGEAKDSEGTPIGRHIDIGQVTQEYRYMGKGSWVLLKTSGGPKYADAAQSGNITTEDLTVGQAILFSTLYDFTETFELDPELFTDVDLVGGITFKSEGMRINVINARIANIAMEEGCLLKTVRGLAVGDSRGEALTKYGQPDSGYFEDRIWTYWFYREFEGAGERILSLDSFAIAFAGDKVDQIRMDAYVPID